MPRSFKRDTGPGFDLTELRWMRQNLGKGEMSLVERKRLVMHRNGRRWEHRALTMDDCELSALFHRRQLLCGHHAVMRAVAAAARREF